MIVQWQAILVLLSYIFFLFPLCFVSMNRMIFASKNICIYVSEHAFLQLDAIKIIDHSSGISLQLSKLKQATVIRFTQGHSTIVILRVQPHD